jgi:HNH endonuclease
MKNRSKYVLSEAAILEYLGYDGVHLRWKKRPPYSRIAVGSVAGGPRWAGHMCFKLNGRQLYAHVVIWWLVKGVWPSDEVDHHNVISGDNVFDNLREATKAQNVRNRRPYKKTGKGLKGAFTHPSFNGRWQSKIVVDGRPIYLGRFDSEEAAHAAYAAAAKVHHGDFARTE